VSRTDQLQIRVTPAEKAALKRLARRAGQGVSAYVLARALPKAQLQFDELVTALADEGKRRFALAELNDLLSDLARAELLDAVSTPPNVALSPYWLNYLAAMVEQAAHQKDASPPAWISEIEPLEQPHFVTPLPGLRLHLLRASPVPFRRRNIFVDSGVGDRV
jgi:uncharacterized protein (DUF1778 family)